MVLEFDTEVSRVRGVRASAGTSGTGGPLR